MSLSANKPVKMVVQWEGRRATLTEDLFVAIATSCLTTHMDIDSNLSGGSLGKGDIASRAMVDGLCAMAHITPFTVQNICTAVFETGHSLAVWSEMNVEVGQAVDKQLPSLPVFDDRYTLDQATFDAIETRLLTHFNVSVARFVPGGSALDKRAWVSTIKLKYRNARRLLFAQAMAQYIAQSQENTHATRSKHYLFWMLVGPIRPK